MNTGQMMITMAAMILLSTVILNVNKNALTTSTGMAESKYQILAVSLGTALIEEAFSKAFDQYTTDGQLVEKKTDLTLNLGPGSGEKNRSDFNDFDDYDGLIDSTSNDSTLQSADFVIASKVYYVDPSTSSNLVPVNYRTWHKKMDVAITSKYIGDGKDTVKLSKVFSHFYFR
jgi:hypothetical protein